MSSDHFTVFVVTPSSQHVAVPARTSERVESFRRRVGRMEFCEEMSGAWTINGWDAPKIMKGRKMLLDGKTLQEEGLCDRCTVSPVYDSHMYSVPVLDPDFYGDMFMIGDESWAEQVGIACHVLLLRGAESFWTAACDLTHQARVGISVRQEADLSFVVDGIAPGSYVDTSSLLQVGDRILQVDYNPCIRAEGLTEEDLIRLRAHVNHAGDAAPGDNDEACIRTVGGALSLLSEHLPFLLVLLRSQTSMRRSTRDQC
eukprot:346951-Hanusia_phi.AAC.3